MSAVSYAYAVFHLNLAFSSIEEENRPAVIRRCYWPLLNIAERNDLRIGVEVPAYTLSVIHDLDPAWVAKLAELIRGGVIELVGSGYAQLIGPLVPAGVNEANLRLGNETYERLLGCRPRLVMVNEQCFSAALVDHFRQAGYSAFLMEWENTFSAHPSWQPEWRYFPQRALGSDGTSLPVIWNHTFAFQKFQRLIHGDCSYEQYWAWLSGQIGPGGRAISLYGNDAEIFDYRPGRFSTEPDLGETSEWSIIERLFQDIVKDGRLRLVLPSQILDRLDQPQAGHSLQLTTPAMPVPTKKQEKYNNLRWAVTGRGDLAINTRCYRLHDALRAREVTSPETWRELCYLWSSDFRTHITEARWKRYLDRLTAFETRLGLAPAQALSPEPESGWVPLDLAGNSHRIATSALTLVVNGRRGLAIERLALAGQEAAWLLGTIPMGAYDDITLGVDFYSGHLIFQEPGRPQITDLVQIRPMILDDPSLPWIGVRAEIPSPLGPVIKTLKVFRDQARLDLCFDLRWRTLPLGTLRMGFLTLNPDLFDEESLAYETHSGGLRAERFRLGDSDFDHGHAVSPLVSAKVALGMTEGHVAIGDARHRLTIRADRSQAAVVGMVAHRQTRGRRFCRVYFSAAEIDDTLKSAGSEEMNGRPMSFSFSISVT